MSSYEIPRISDLIPELYLLKGEKKRALLILLHLFEISASHSWRWIPERKKTKKQICGFYCIWNYNVHHICTAEIEFIQTFLLTPSLPRCLPLSLSSLSFCLIDVSDGETRIPRPFVVFRAELGEGQEVTLGKVTDERAVEGGGREVAVKAWVGDRQDRSQGLKKKKRKKTL